MAEYGGIMERILIKDVLSESYIGKPITVCGWVRSRRESKGFAFLVCGVSGHGGDYTASCLES